MACFMKVLFVVIYGTRVFLVGTGMHVFWDIGVI